MGGEGGRIYRSSNPNPFGWTLLSHASNGFGDSGNQKISSFCEFKGYLYAGTRNWNTGSEIWRTSDGSNWSVINETTNGFNSTDMPPHPNEVLCMIVFSNRLYAGCDDGAIFRTSNGTNWEQVKNGSAFGLGEPVYSFVVYSNYLYVATLDTWMWVGKLYRSSTGNSGSWQVVNDDGWGDINNSYNKSLGVFKNALFVGNNNWIGAAIYSDLIFDYIKVVKYGNTAERFVAAGSTNIAVIGFKPIDMSNHNIEEIKIQNLGNMSNGLDVTNLKLWYDVNKNLEWDTNDVLATGPAVYSNATKKWCFTVLAVPSGTNLIVTIDIPLSARTNQWFKALIYGKLHNGDVICASGGTSINSISNTNRIVIGLHIYEVTLNTNFPTTNVGYTSWPGVECLSFHIKDTGEHPVTTLKIENLGTMSNSDINNIILYYDTDNSFTYTVGDSWIGSMSYNSTEDKWVYKSGGFNPPIDSNTNIIALIQTVQNGEVSNTFKAKIDVGDVLWSCGAFNTTAISNTNFITRIDEVVPYKLSDLPLTNAFAGQTNITVLNWTVSNYYPTRTISLIRLGNNGTAENGFDISAVKLWRDIDSSGDWTAGDTLLSTAAYNGTGNYWEFSGLGVTSGWELVATVNLTNSARSNRTFIGVVKEGNIWNIFWVYSTKPITNNNPVIIKNTNDFVTITQNSIYTGARYTVTSNYQNKEVLAFKFFDTKGHALKVLNIMNLSNMQAGADISAVTVWQDNSTIGRYDSGDVFMGNLVWNGSSKWTNYNLSIPEGSDILITIDTTPTLNGTRTFRAAISNVSDIQCANDVSAGTTITNQATLHVDFIPPDSVNIMQAFSSVDKMKLFWNGVTNSDLNYYEIVYDTTSHPSWSGYANYTNTSSTNILITGLLLDTIYYYRIRAVDSAGNRGASINEAQIRTTGVFSLNLNQMNSDGFGNGGNSQRITKQIVFQSNIYVSVMNWNGCKIYRSKTGGKWKQVNEDGFGSWAQADATSMAVFSNYLYVGVDAGFGPPTGCEIWRTSDGTNWERVVDGGVEDTSQNGVLSMAMFNGALYAGTRYNFGGTPGCEIWKTTDGTNWSKVNIEGFGDANNRGAHSMAVFNGRLYVGVDNWNGTEIWYSSDGTTWNQVTSVSNGFGNTLNQEIDSMLVFNNRIYAGTYNWNTGCEIWGSADGTNNWNKVVSEGFLNQNNSYCISLGIYSNYLFAGTETGGQTFEWFRTSNGTNWKKFNNNGFGDNNNIGLESMVVFNSNLFVGTMNWNTGCEEWSDVPDKVEVVKVSDVPSAQVSPNQTNVAVLNFKIIDLLEYNIDTIKIKNLGTMQNGTDVNVLKLWYDVDNNGKYSDNDVQVGFPAVWNGGTSTYDFLFLNAAPDTNLILTIDIADTATIGHSFQAMIDFNDVKCSGGTLNIDTSITNNGVITLSSNYYVQTNGKNINLGTAWGINNAWQTISHAVNNVPNGATIYVADGVYPEAVFVIGQSSITIIATNVATVDAQSLRNYCFYMTNSTNIKLKNFEIRNAQNSGIYLLNTVGMTFDNNSIFSNVYGVNAISSKNFQAINNNIYLNSTNGLRITLSGNNIITNNNIYYNGEAEVFMLFSKTNYINKNMVYGTNRGILLVMGHNNRITNNRVKNETTGIINYITTNNFILNNVIYSNTSGGIALFKAYSNNVSYNRISENTNGVVVISNSHKNFLSYNTNIKNYRIGIGIVGGNQNNIIYNNIFYSSNSLSGVTNGSILIKDSYNNIITNNSLYGGNEFFGIAIISNADGNRIIANTISGSNYSGIALLDVSNNYVKQNSISECSFGVYLTNVTFSTLIGNNLLNNVTNGIRIEDCTNLYIAYNYVANSGESGFMVQGSRCEVFLNTIVSNNVGISVTNTTLSNFTKNNIYTNNSNFLSLTTYNLPLTNNWWGTTIFSNIMSKVQGATNLIPYRLFGPFDITEGADTDSPPRVTGVSASIVSKTNVSLKWNSSVSAVRYFVYRNNINSTSNFTKNSVIGITTSTNWTNYNLTDSEWYFFITALDSANYTNESWYSTDVMVRIDTTGPAKVTLISPTNSFVTNSQNIPFLWNSTTDTGVGVTNYEIFITNEKSSWATNIIITSTNISISNIPANTNYWYVRGIDKRTNYGEYSSTNILIIDLSPSVITLVSPASNATSGSVDVLFQWSANDVLSGVSEQRIEIDTNNNIGNGFEVQVTTNSPYTYTFAGNGTNNWRVWAKDGVGNTNYSSIFPVIIDTNLPIASLYRPLLVYTNTNTVGFAWSDESGKGATSNIIQISTTNNFSTIICSNSGNAAFTNWTVSPPLSTGKYYWRVITYKLSTTTWYTSSVGWVYVDTNSPGSATLLLPVNNSMFSNDSVKFLWNTASDIGSGIKNYVIEISTNNFSTILTNSTVVGTNITINFSGNSLYWWRVISYDMADNVNISLTNRFLLDTTSPSIVTPIAPTNNSMTNNNNVEFIWHKSTDTGAGVTNYNMQISTNAGFSVVVTNILTTNTNYIINLSDDIYYWRINTMDKAGNWSGWSKTNLVKIDTTGPSRVLISLPFNNAATNVTNINFEWQKANDTIAGVTNYEFKITNINALWSTNLITSQTDYTVTNLQQGTNYWYVRAQDKANNWGEYSSTNMLLIDLTKPVITFISPVSNSTNGTVDVLFQWSANDVLSGISEQRIEIDTDNNIGNGFEVQVTTNSPYTYTFAGNGTNNWRVYVADKAGNTNYSSIWRIVIDTNYHKVSLQITNITLYVAAVASSNVPVLAFKYSDTQNHPLTILRVTNLGTMSNTQDVVRVKVWDDSGTILAKFDGTETLIDYLEYDSSIGKWTNNNIMITNNTDVLITIDISAGAGKGRSFRAAIVSTNDAVCSNGKSLSILITNSGSIIIDNIPPIFDGNYTINFINQSKINLQWSAATDTAYGYNPITYKIYVSQSPILTSFNFSVPGYSVLNATSITIDDLPAGDNYFVILAFDNSGNVSTNTNTHQAATIKRYENTLEELRIYPIPVRSGESLKIDKLTKTATIRIYSITGILVLEKDVDNFSGDAIQIRLDDYNIASGVYIVVVSNGNEIKKSKIVYIK